jgi:hypothetical protein
VGGYDVAARLVEDGKGDVGVCCAEGFPVAKGSVERGDVAVSDEDGGEVDLRALGVEIVLRYDLGA